MTAPPAFLVVEGDEVGQFGGEIRGGGQFGGEGWGGLVVKGEVWGGSQFRGWLRGLAGGVGVGGAEPVGGAGAAPLCCFVLVLDGVMVGRRGLVLLLEGVHRRRRR